MSILSNINNLYEGEKVKPKKKFHQNSKKARSLCKIILCCPFSLPFLAYVYFFNLNSQVLTTSQRGKKQSYSLKEQLEIGYLKETLKNIIAFHPQRKTLQNTSVSSYFVVKTHLEKNGTAVGAKMRKYHNSLH